ncbi:T9SS type A sorting domain-containing protein [Marivirga tractuosa]|uniref:T9SS type A sorting domain-containing protein n=1 Tax=Marivirga tractuosa TaxID=1006 RepID=UPI0035CEFE7B
MTPNQSKIDYQSVRIYPNPTSNYYLNIQSDAFNSEEIVLQLHNLNGKVVHSENVNNNQLKIGYRMELPNQLNNGMYQLKIVDGGKLGIFKIILR